MPSAILSRSPVHEAETSSEDLAPATANPIEESGEEDVIPFATNPIEDSGAEDVLPTANAVEGKTNAIENTGEEDVTSPATAVEGETNPTEDIGDEDVKSSATAVEGETNTLKDTGAEDVKSPATVVEGKKYSNYETRLDGDIIHRGKLEDKLTTYHVLRKRTLINLDILEHYGESGLAVDSIPSFISTSASEDLTDLQVAQELFAASSAAIHECLKITTIPRYGVMDSEAFRHQRNFFCHDYLVAPKEEDDHNHRVVKTMADAVRGSTVKFQKLLEQVDSAIQFMQSTLDDEARWVPGGTLERPFVVCVPLVWDNPVPVADNEQDAVEEVIAENPDAAEQNEPEPDSAVPKAIFNPLTWAARLLYRNSEKVRNACQWLENILAAPRLELWEEEGQKGWDDQYDLEPWQEVTVTDGDEQV